MTMFSKGDEHSQEGPESGEDVADIKQKIRVLGDTLVEHPKHVKHAPENDECHEHRQELHAKADEDITARYETIR